MPNTPQTIPVKGVNDASGKLVRYRVYNPDGTTAGSFALGENVNGNAVGLGTYNGTGTITFAGVDGWASAEAREVATQDDAGFNAATLVLAGPGVIGYVKSGVLLSDPNLDAAVSTLASTVNTGSVVVSWNYNGNDFRILRGLGASQVGISGAKVYAYINSEYIANPNTAPVRGYAVTDDSGKWVGMGLSSGVTYLLRAVVNDGSPVVTAVFTV